MMISKLDFYIGVLALGLAVVAHGYFSNKKVDEATLQQVQKQFQAAHEQDQQTIKTAQTAEAQNQKDTAAKIVFIHDQQAQPVNPVDYAKIDAMISDHVGAKSVTSTVDNTPQTVVPTKPLRDFTLNCDANKIELDGCRVTTANLQTQTDALKQDNLGLTQKSAAEEKIIHGGTYKGRLLRGLKHTLCGAGGMGAGLLVNNAQRDGGKTGAIAGAGVWGACEALVSAK